MLQEKTEDFHATIRPRVAVQSLSRVGLFVTPGTAARPASLSFAIRSKLNK